MNPVTTANPRSIDAARWAISTVFLLNGAGIGLWAAHVPTVQARMGIDTGMLSMVLLTVAAGALLAMPLMGGLTGRWGTRRMVLLSGFAFAAMTPLIMGAPSLPLLFIAAFLFGVSNGALDVAMNANASEVESARGLPTMSSFHGFFSLGGLFGAGIGGLLVGQGLGHGQGALMVGVVTAVVLALSAPRVMGFAATHGAGSHFSLPRGAALSLGLLALLCFAVEGALVDWSALLMEERTGATPASAALGFSAFSIAMAACRFAGDRLIVRFGALRIMVIGGLAMFAGLALAVASTHFVLSAVGFALVGLGAANVVPLLFGAAARIPGMSAGNGVAAVATLGYGGLLLAPPVLGWVAMHSSIMVALGGLSLSGLVIALSARIIRR
ncbi:MAG: MFS transporter [Massilia sp.]|uniref:MFS transporter n=1 Tax=Massilia sp. TaxID=1882437 RepID=UPI00199B751B|nr:MFS transporter [Oxalobacteraceae sp. CFBP 8761]MBD8625457.1 MFS transporter [Oxalobacteraceae sp. CFBP 8753]MBD8629894.1 MFS transporter [Oxalobacteraceae sp. CFBP 8755]